LLTSDSHTPWWSNALLKKLNSILAKGFLIRKMFEPRKNDDLLVKCRKKVPVRGWRLSKKGKKQKDFLYPAKKKPSPGRMAQTPLAHIGESVG